LPGRRALFTANLMGAPYGALPHRYTPRGDRQRSARFFHPRYRALIVLKPEVLITGRRIGFAHLLDHLRNLPCRQQRDRAHTEHQPARTDDGADRV
jgi:hypothetical protein